VQWDVGAVSEARWRGTSLRNVLADVADADARFVVLEGADSGPFRDAGAVPFARALPLEKALHPDTLLVWEMNGEPLPAGHGAPLRAIVPGWYAADSVKWLSRIALVDKPFAGPFEAIDYRLATAPTDVGERLTTLAVHSLLTSHRPGGRVDRGRCVFRGIAWGGEGGAARVEVSVDGQTWHDAELKPAASEYGLTRWEFAFPAEPGVLSVAIRATDAAGRTQPSEPLWNEGGYANSSIQRVSLHVH
jgi:DMSO/TMAO reductase YedYZ molybdopterin-dependent catalytic subunit